jgi:hypothetical protein
MSEVLATVVRDVSPGLSGTEAALYGGLGGGILALFGVIVERVLRLTGFLRFEASEWAARFVSGDDWDRKELSSDDEAAASAERVEFSFAVDLFNGKEVPTGLRDIKVELVRKRREQPLTSRPEDRQSGSRENRWRYSRVDVINLAPRQFLRMELQGMFDREGVLALASEKWKRIDFVGERPKRPILGVLGSKTYRKPITDPENEKRRGVILDQEIEKGQMIPL